MSPKWSSIASVCVRTQKPRNLEPCPHLEAITQFAEGANHEEIVPQCLHSEEIKNKIAAFFFFFFEKTGFVGKTEAASCRRGQCETGERPFLGACC